MTSDNSNDAAIELSVVVPCYNEKNAIRDTVSLLSEHLAPLGVRVTRLSRGLPAGSSIAQVSRSILADAVEAILGAIYLDGGLEPVENLLRRVFADAFSRDAVPVQRDPKTRLQEWVMARTGAFPVYECIGNSEIDGDEDRFTVNVMVGEEVWGEGVGRSKRKAQRVAAAQALERVDRIESDPQA